jgi:hypothetical protein
MKDRRKARGGIGLRFDVARSAAAWHAVCISSEALSSAPKRSEVMITTAWILGSVFAVGATWLLALRAQEMLERRQQRHFLTNVLGPNLRTQTARPRVQVVTVAVETSPSPRRAGPGMTSVLTLLPYHAAGTML